jgi:hypothetical protein
MQKIIFIKVICFVFSVFILCASTIVVAGKHDEVNIKNLLAAQAVEWNKGNIDGYMIGYWHSDSLIFIGSKGVRYGYTKTLNRYKEAYPDADHMGLLSLNITQMKKLSRHYYFVVGKWALKRKAGDIEGSFTLLLQKINGKWQIICDHSS